MFFRRAVTNTLEGALAISLQPNMDSFCADIEEEVRLAAASRVGLRNRYQMDPITRSMLNPLIRQLAPVCDYCEAGRQQHKRFSHSCLIVLRNTCSRSRGPESRTPKEEIVRAVSIVLGR